MITSDNFYSKVVAKVQKSFLSLIPLKKTTQKDVFIQSNEGDWNSLV